MPQGSELQRGLQQLEFIRIGISTGHLRENGHRRGFDVQCGIEDFLNTGHTQSDVFGRNTGCVESVQGHLRRGFTDRLSTHDPDHLAWVHFGLDKLVLHFAENLEEHLMGEFFYNAHAFG